MSAKAYILATGFMQARDVARKMGLDLSDWEHVSLRRHLDGADLARLYIASPVLHGYAEFFALLDEARALARAQGHEPVTVPT